VSTGGDGRPDPPYLLTALRLGRMCPSPEGRYGGSDLVLLWCRALTLYMIPQLQSLDFSRVTIMDRQKGRMWAALNTRLLESSKSGGEDASAY
jgi:hypothetical protein